jgi:hypothetical protein
VITEEDDGVEGRIDPLHHRERPRERADQRDIRREAFGQDVLRVAVRVGDGDVGRAGLARAGDGGEHLIGHEAAETLVFEAARKKLFAGHDPGDALHVGGDVDLQSLP